MPDRHEDSAGRVEQDAAPGSTLTPERLDTLLSRLFTEELRQDEAEAILDELAPAAGELVTPLVNLLSSPDSHTRQTASQILVDLAHPSAAGSVRRLLERRGLADATRLAAYTTLEGMGQALDAEALLSSLADPASLFESSLDDLLAGLADDQHAAALWESMAEADREMRLELLHGLGERRDRRARKLLAAALWDEKSEVVLAAVAALRELGDPGAADSLIWLAEISRNASVREAARAAAVEIRIRSSVRGEGLEPPAAPECWASFIDGDGAQLLMAVRPATGSAPARHSDAGGALRLASVYLSDHRGIVDASGTDTATRAEVEALRSASSRRSVGEGRPGARSERGGPSPRAGGEELPEDELPEIGWVPVDAAYCAAAIEAARQINRRDRRRLPAVWEFWRDTFFGPDTLESPAPDDRAVPEGQLRRRLTQTTTLIQFEGFDSWLIQMEDLAPFLPSAHEAMAMRAREREERLSQVVSACLQCVTKVRQRRLWRSRLLRQAALWQRRGDRIVSELCLAAAWGLDDRNGVPSEEHPLLRAMTRASLEMAMGF